MTPINGHRIMMTTVGGLSIGQCLTCPTYHTDGPAEDWKRVHRNLLRHAQRKEGRDVMRETV